VLNGSTWVSLVDQSLRVQLKKGDFVIVPHGKAHMLGDRASRSTMSRHNIPELVPVTALDNGAVRNDDTHFMCGYFRFSQGTLLPFLNQLPGLLVVKSGQAKAQRNAIDLFELIQHEVQNYKTVSLAVLNRLTEIMFYYAVRQWLENALLPDGALAALGDPHLQRALAKIHTSPEINWTVEDLAKSAGHSRTTFSNRFHEATGYAPIEYLTHWRVELAGRFLAESDLSLDEIASRIGYVDTNAFSRAFSRLRGIPPGSYRKVSRD
jgi:AraC-like DNA-binding protein